MSAALRARKCKNPDCRKRFDPATPFEKLCSDACMEAVIERAMEVARVRRQRAAREQRLKLRRELRAGRERLKTISKRLQEAQRAFNAWIRWRDRNEPCISCGTPNAMTWHAGHYKPAHMNAALRFNPLNVHRQCEPCNTFKSGDLVSYRARLVEKIGLEFVLMLEGPQPEVKWTHDELKAIRREYQTRLREAQKAA